jgi:antitoxin component YwqK of YwqJK toxin-antitoxin module
MKNCFTIIFLSLSILGNAQRIEKVYDANWKETTQANIRYYSVIVKKDSLWQRQNVYIPERTLQMQGSYKDSSCKIKHGDFTYFHSNKNLQETGEYVNDKKEGIWLRFHSNKMLADSAFYIKGKMKGAKMKWDLNGMLTDSIHGNEDGTKVSVSWFENGQPSHAGRLDSNELKTGKWQFFYPDGKISALVYFKNDTEITSEMFDKNGTITTDTSLKHREAAFKAGSAAWLKYLERGVNPNIATNNRAPIGKHTVIIQFVVDIDGKIKDVEALTNIGYGMEKEVIDIIKKASKWEPAYYYGRPVKAYRRQPLTFQVSQ